MNFYLKSIEETLQNLNTGEAGLANEEAKKRLLEFGRNELKKAKKKSLLKSVAEQIVNPMVLMLLGAATISVVLATIEGGGAGRYAEAGVILAVVILNSILGVYQESKAEK